MYIHRLLSVFVKYIMVLAFWKASKLFYGLGPEPMEISQSSTLLPTEVPSCDVTILEGHTSEV